MIECKFHDRTTTSEAVKTKQLWQVWQRWKLSFMCHVCTQCVHTPHTHIWRTAKLSDQIHKHWMQNPSIGQKLSQQSQHHTPLIELHYSSCQQFQLTFIQPLHLLVINFSLAHRLFSPSFLYQPTCTTLGLTCARNKIYRVSGVDSSSLWWPTLGSWVTHPPSVLPSVPTFHLWSKHMCLSLYIPPMQKVEGFEL